MAIRPKAGFLDLFSFLGSVLVTIVLGWSTKDLIWSFWISSLLSGFLFQAYGSFSPSLGDGKNPVERVLSFFGGLFGMAFFALHFGAFHYVQGSILDLLIPLINHPGRVYVGKLTWSGGEGFPFLDTFQKAVVSYWMFVILSVFHDFKRIFTVAESQRYFEPYKKVLRMHFLIFFLGGLYSIGLETFPVYLLCLLFYFAPPRLWGYLFQKLKRANEPIDNAAGAAAPRNEEL